MAKRSVQLNEQTETYINQRNTTDDKPNISSHLNQAIAQLNYLSRTERPELTIQEWRELYNVYAGSDMTMIALPIDLANDVLVHYGANVPQQTDCSELVLKLREMTQIQQYALIDAVRIYWANDAGELTKNNHGYEE